MCRKRGDRPQEAAILVQRKYYILSNSCPVGPSSRKVEGMEQLKQIGDKIYSQPLIAVPLTLSMVVGAFVSIAVGFRVTYEIVVTIGARL
jgi:hypothetical protein